MRFGLQTRLHAARKHRCHRSCCSKKDAVALDKLVQQRVAWLRPLALRQTSSWVRSRLHTKDTMFCRSSTDRGPARGVHRQAERTRRQTQLTDQDTCLARQHEAGFFKESKRTSLVQTRLNSVDLSGSQLHTHQLTKRGKSEKKRSLSIRRACENTTRKKTWWCISWEK